MTAEITRLANGLTIVTETTPHLETSALGVWVDAGARHEREDEHGLSHLLEHMAFKGTATRSTQDIARRSKRWAANSTRPPVSNPQLLRPGPQGRRRGGAGDHCRHSSEFDVRGRRTDKEREVILQEIAGTLDSPDDIAFDLVHDAAYPDQPAGRTILGSRRA